MLPSARSVFAALAMLFAAAAAHAGPDVVVSGVGDSIIRYGTNMIGGVPVTGYAIGSTACNIGDADAVWMQFTNQHPVIGQQAYRLHGGRMEQIGLSWVKHAFCAADFPSCVQLGPPGATYRPNEPNCDYLGLFANDTYSASLNGFQNYLGPRSEVNASTGAFNYPYTLNWNTPGNCAFKRLQIANADLDPANFPGARYFFEVHYLTTDEDLSSRSNNASYREFAVGALTNSTLCTSDPGLQSYALTYVGGTQVFKPAVLAWQDADPSVTAAASDIPGDGRIIVAGKATDLGGNLWQYEYAVYNHNSDRSVGAFGLGKSDNIGVVINNIGFHDVTHHSGEPYDGTDWPGVINAHSVDWATAPFASNPNANAIRWGTTYNFRLQANRPPTSGSVTLGLFKPGTPATIVVGGLPIPSMPVPCPGDFNDSGAVSVQDIFDFLAAYFAGEAAADFNDSGVVSVQDIFDFLAAYFTPCPQ